MKKIFNFIFLLISITVFHKLTILKVVKNSRYRLHYGFLNAGTELLPPNQITYKGKPHYRVTGVGRSTGAVRAFFKVDDVYESCINIATGLPVIMLRNVSGRWLQKTL